MPLLTKRYDSIIVCGERVKVSDHVKIVTFKDPGGMSFEKARASENAISDYYAPRRLKGNPVTTLEELSRLLTMIVLHSDLTPSSAECFNVLVRRGLSTHFMIDVDGTIYQAADVLYATYHAGEVNNISIGIDLNNEMPNLLENREYRYEPPADKNLRRPLSEIMVINGTRCRSYGYSDAQYVALLELLKTLLRLFPDIKPEHPFNEKGEVITTMLEDMNFFGILGHWHISPTRWDPGPGFDWQRVFHGLASEHNFFPVEIEKGKNIATLLTAEKIREAAEEICLANERAEGGGYYPIGINQNWHGGIHIPCPKGTPVKAAFKGVLVAARIGEGGELGDNNFVLLRHDIKLQKERVLKLFSLYMHLSKMPLDNSKERLEWVRAAHRVKRGLEEEEEAIMQEVKKPEKELTNEDDEELDKRQERFYLKSGDHLSALKEGNVALFPVSGEDAIHIASGDVIGFSGEFGDGVNMESLIHLEFFTDREGRKAIDMGIHGEFFREIEAEDTSGSLLVSSDEILKYFEIPKWKLTRLGKGFKKRVLSESDIVNFFATDSEEKFSFRKMITRHVSEWSDQVDWVKTLYQVSRWDEKIEKFEEWEREGIGAFRKEIVKFLPFIWLTEDVAKHIGLKVDKWDGVLYHFHPIHLIVWLTLHSAQRILVLSQGKSLKELKAEAEKERKRIEEQRRKGRMDINSEHFHDEMVVAGEVKGEGTRDIFEDLLHKKMDGEWK